MYLSGGILSGGVVFFFLLVVLMIVGVLIVVVVGFYGLVIFGGVDIIYRLIKGGLMRKWFNEVDMVYEVYKIIFLNLLGDFFLKLIKDIKVIELKIEII